MVILGVILVILLTVVIVYLIDKTFPKKYKSFVLLGLWTLIIFLGYITFMSVYGEIQFNQLQPTFRGRMLNIPSFRNTTLQEICFLISNKVEEDFSLEIDYVKIQ